MINRREMLTIAGAAAALYTAKRAEAVPPSLRGCIPTATAACPTVPTEASCRCPDNPTLATAANNCAAAAEACLRHCIAMLSSGNTSMAACARTAADMGPAARALAEIAAGGSAHVAAFAAVVGQIAKDCKTECDKHLTMAPCKACADSCAALIATIK